MIGANILIITTGSLRLEGKKNTTPVCVSTLTLIITFVYIFGTITEL